MTSKQWVGRRVRVSNPTLPAVWMGKVISYIDQPTFLIETDDGERLALPAAWAEEDKTGQIMSVGGILLNTLWKARKSERIVKVIEFTPHWGWRRVDGKSRKVEIPGEYDFIVNVIQTGSGNKPRGRQGEERWRYPHADFIRAFKPATD